MSVYLPIVERASRALVLQTRRDTEDRRISRDELSSDLLRHLVGHWERLRNGRPLPSRRDLRPEDMGFSHAQVMLVDIHWPSAVTETDDPTFRFRLVGARIEETGLRDLAGRWAHELEPDFYRESILRAYREAALSAQPSIRRISYATDDGSLHYERVVLPMANQGTTPDALLVGMDWESLDREQFRALPALKS